MNPFFYNAYAMPFGMSRLFEDSPDLKDYYFSLPEEAQQAILNEDIHSEKDFHDCVEKLKRKE